jgi:hypothetical protein
MLRSATPLTGHGGSTLNLITFFGGYFVFRPEFGLFIFRKGFHKGLPARAPVDMPSPETAQERFRIGVKFGTPGTLVAFGFCHFLLLSVCWFLHHGFHSEVIE